MTSTIEFVIRQLYCSLFQSLILVWGFHLWDKVKYPFSLRKWIAVFFIFTSVFNVVGIQIGVMKGIAKYIELPKSGFSTSTNSESFNKE